VRHGRVCCTPWVIRNAVTRQIAWGEQDSKGGVSIISFALPIIRMGVECIVNPPIYMAHRTSQKPCRSHTEVRSIG
jgi:hypothetical protein